MKKCTFCNGSGKTNKNVIFWKSQIGKNVCKKCNGKGMK